MISVASATSTRNWSVSHPVWASPVLASKLPSIPWILAISSSWGQLQNNYYLIYNACWVVHISNHTAKYEGNIYLCPAKVAWLHSMFSLKSSRNDWYTKLRYNYMHIMGKTILRNDWWTSNTSQNLLDKPCLSRNPIVVATSQSYLLHKTKKTEVQEFQHGFWCCHHVTGTFIFYKNGKVWA